MLRFETVQHCAAIMQQPQFEVVIKWGRLEILLLGTIGGDGEVCEALGPFGEGNLGDVWKNFSIPQLFTLFGPFFAFECFSLGRLRESGGSLGLLNGSFKPANGC